jgi:hypothetical protein
LLLDARQGMAGENVETEGGNLLDYDEKETPDES